VRLRVTEHVAGGERAHEDRVVTEEPLEIRLAAGSAPARRVWVTMRTPGHDFELATGFAVHEGLIAPSSLRQVAYCTDEVLSPAEEHNVVTLTVDHATDTGRTRDLAALASGSSACGVCGSDSVEAALAVPHGPRWAGPLPDVDVVRRLPGRLRQAQVLFERTGGLHAAALADASGEVLVVREDVGRHNAVDKVTGARVLGGENPAEACLVVSGRAGFELVQKAVVAGVGMLVAVGAPTSLSVRLAREHGLALIGFTSADRCVRYA
jgi:FdhD protein